MTDFERNVEAESNQPARTLMKTVKNAVEKRGGKLSMSVHQAERGGVSIPVDGARSLDDVSDNHDDLSLKLDYKVDGSMTHEARAGVVAAMTAKALNSMYRSMIYKPGRRSQ